MSENFDSNSLGTPNNRMPLSRNQSDQVRVDRNLSIPPSNPDSRRRAGRQAVFAGRNNQLLLGHDQTRSITRHHVLLG